jgi:propionyl-CoA carboxylase alpha chain
LSARLLAPFEAMGDKITSKKLAAAAGVSTVPGHMGLIADAEHAVTISPAPSAIP